MSNLERPYRVAWLLILAACADPTSIVIVEPELEAMTARAFPFRFQEMWGLIVEGMVSEGSELTSNSRLPIHVSTTSGDVEELRLWPRVCESEAGGRHLCGTFLFSMEQGRHVDDVRPLLGQLRGGLAFVGTNGSWASVWLFDGEAEQAMGLVRRWPGVQSVSHDGLAFAGPIPPLLGPVVNVSPIDIDSARPGDGRVQARPGDVVAVRYSSAEGLGMSASFTMCEPQAGSFGTPITGLGRDPSC